MTISRIFQVIEYLHSCSFLFRDLKPSNILLDNDFLPYVSDFDYTRDLNDDLTLTNCIGSVLYMSPEQYNGDNYSYSTDIYSFGLIIYFLFEKSHMIQDYENSYFKNENDKIPPMKNGSINIQKLYESCLNFKPEKRPKNSEIKNYIINEINSFEYFEHYIMKEKTPENTFFILKFIYENVSILFGNNQKLKEYLKLVNIMNIIIFIKLNEDESSFLLNLGMYYKSIGNYKKAKYYLELSANQNNSDAYLYLGNMYEFGQGVEKNYSLAIKMYECSKSNNPKAYRELAYMYGNGIGVERDRLKAEKYFKIAASKNDTESFFNLGFLYEKGLGSEQNYYKAIKYYEKAAAQNDSQALLRLGIIYQNGLGVEKDYKKALEYFQFSSYLNNSTAFNSLGIFYAKGIGGIVDYEKAKYYFEKSANLNNPQAINNLGFLYEKGFGVHQSYLKALEYYKKAAQGNCLISFVNLGMFYYKGLGVMKDYSVAKFYFKKAADQNVIESFRMLGNLYEEEDNIEKNYSISKYFYEKAANKNDSESFVALGELYFNGHGVKKDYEIAKYYYEKAAQQNNGNAFFLLGNLYLNGYGVNKSYQKAIHYYQQAIKNNNKEAYINLGIIYQYGLSVPKDINRAIKYYKSVENKNFSSAFYNLAIAYRDGDGKNFKTDINKSKYYFEKAAYFNNPIAFLDLGCLFISENNLKKAKECFEKATKFNISEAFINLGLMNLNGNGVDKNINKAYQQFKLGLQLNNPDAAYFLAKFFSSNFKQEIFYLLKCIQISNNINKSLYYYISFNDLGLIYMIVYEDLEKAKKFIYKSACAEYPFAQNNFALFNLLYTKNINEAKYFFKKAAKLNFALSEYILGYMKEKAGKVEKSIKYYVKASDHENNALFYYSLKYDDERFEISKTFIICFVNLKLVIYYLLNNNFNETKKYFIRSFYNIESDQYKFSFILKNRLDENTFLYLRKFILNYPKFNIKKEMNLLSETQNFDLNEDNTGYVFDDTGYLFDYIINNNQLLIIFYNEIQKIVYIMNTILYMPPYSILFGRISCSADKIGCEKEKNLLTKNIDKYFYQGFYFNQK